MTTIAESIRADTAAKLRTDLPLNCHPDSAIPVERVLAVEGTPGVEMYRSARTALKHIYDNLGAMRDADRALREALPGAPLEMHGGTTRVAIPKDKRNEFARALEASMTRAGKAVDNQLATVRRQRDVLAKRIEEALLDPDSKTTSGIAQAGEIRAHVKSLSKKARSAMLNEMVESGDRATLTAILSGPTYLSGLTAAEVASLKDRAELKLAPVDRQQRDAADKLLDLIATAGSAFVGEFGKMLPREAKETAPADVALNRLMKGDAHVVA